MHNLERPLSFPALLNLRELGGHPTTDGGQTRWGSLLRSDDLAQLTGDGVKALADYGVITVLDLRWAEEIELSPSPLRRRAAHIHYVHVSLLASTPARWRQLSASCDKEQWKCLVLERARDGLAAALRAIADAAPAPLLFHCVAGKDRTGIIAALMLRLADVEPEAIAADYARSTEMLSAPYLERYRDADPAELLETLRCPPEAVHNMLAYLDRQGGIHAYLRAIGLSAVQIARLRARLRD